MNPLDHLHPAIIHFPIALLLVASAGGLLYLLAWPRAELRLLVWGTMALGWVACGAAILSGLLAQAGLPPEAPYRPVLNLHIGAGLGILLVYGIVLYLGWIQRSERARRERARRGFQETLDLLDDPGKRWLTAALLVAGAALVFLTGLNGGELVYIWGVNVAR